MFKKIFLFNTFISFFFFANAQDVLLLNNGKEINAKLLFVDSATISYSLQSKLNTILKKEAFKIILQNGEEILLKSETMYSQLKGDDLIIFTNDSVLNVKIVQIENENLVYMYNNSIANVNLKDLKFIKYANGFLTMADNFIEYKDKIILKNGNEILNVRWLKATNSHFVYQEKNLNTTSQIALNEVFVVKKANNEKIFPPTPSFQNLNYKNFAFGISYKAQVGDINSSSSYTTISSKSRLATIGLSLGYKYHKNAEIFVEPLYSTYQSELYSDFFEIEIDKAHLGINVSNRIYLTDRFNFQLGLSINRVISSFYIIKFIDVDNKQQLAGFYENIHPKRFNIGIQPGFGWKGRRVALDFVYQYLNSNSIFPIESAYTNFYGIRLEFLLYNSNFFKK